MIALGYYIIFHLGVWSSFFYAGGSKFHYNIPMNNGGFILPGLGVVQIQHPPHEDPQIGEAEDAKSGITQSWSRHSQKNSYRDVGLVSGQLVKFVLHFFLGEVHHPASLVFPLQSFFCFVFYTKRFPFNVNSVSVMLFNLRFCIFFLFKQWKETKQTNKLHNAGYTNPPFLYFLLYYFMVLIVFVCIF